MKFVYGSNYQIYFLVILDNHSRVILSGDEKTDYINASFIDVGANMHAEEYCIVHMKVFQQFCLILDNFLSLFITFLQGLTEKYYIATQGTM
jgi:hypothetical protein